MSRLSSLGIRWGGTLLGQIITAVICAVLLLWVISLIKKKETNNPFTLTLALCQRFFL